MAAISQVTIVPTPCEVCLTSLMALKALGAQIEYKSSSLNKKNVCRTIPNDPKSRNAIALAVSGCGEDPNPPDGVNRHADKSRRVSRRDLPYTTLIDAAGEEIDCGAVRGVVRDDRGRGSRTFGRGFKSDRDRTGCFGLNVPPVQVIGFPKNLRNSRPLRATCEIDSSVAPTLVTMMDFVELPDVVLTDPKLKSSRSYRTLCGRHFLQGSPVLDGIA